MTPQDRENIFKNLLLVVAADGIVSDREQVFLARARIALAIDTNTESRLKSEVQASGKASYPVADKGNASTALRMMVAAADGHMDAREQEMIARFAQQSGLSPEEILSALTNERPPAYSAARSPSQPVTRPQGPPSVVHPEPADVARLSPAGASAAATAEFGAPAAQPKSSPSGKIVLWLLVIWLGGTAIYAVCRELGLLYDRYQYSTEIDEIAAASAPQMEELAARFETLKADPAVLAGTAAEENRRKEWEARLRKEAIFAATPREQTLLKIQTIAKDSSLTAQDLLREVALLASPQGANVTVNHSGGQGYVTKVTFDMSAMTHGEVGSATKHTSKDSLQREVREIIGRVMKDLWAYCGSKGIEKVQVACTHGVQMASDIEMLRSMGIDPSQLRKSKDLRTTSSIETIRIYECSISGADAMRIPDWKAAAVHRVIEMMKVDYDKFPELTITTTRTPGYGW